MKTLVIAEIGSAWRFGDWHLGNAYRAIDVAHECGADVIKFQWVSDPRAMEKRRNVPAYSYDILAWPAAWIGLIREYTESVGIEFLCTCFLPCDVAILNEHVKRWKVASLECEYSALINAMVRTKKSILRSMGASNDEGEIYIQREYKMQCTAAYPAPLDQLNLAVLAKDGGYSGYSDHSGHVLTGALALACGAEIIEVHFKLDDTPKDNPDYKHSHSPQRLCEYIDNIRAAELMLGDGDKRVMPCEQWALKHKVKA